MGMAGDMFSAALIGLGASENGVIEAMHTAGALLGGIDIEVLHGTLPQGLATRQISVDAQEREPLSFVDAPAFLEKALRASGVRGGYAGFAHRALVILCEAERVAHGILGEAAGEKSQAPLTIVGRAHTPYGDQAPYQPMQESDAPSDGFYVEMDPAYVDGLAKLESFSHLYVVSYLHRSSGYGLLVRPPWKEGAEQYGLFATRSPNRPSPIGLTRVRIHRVEGRRVYTGPLDLFDGTPILDLKPFIGSLDGAPAETLSEPESGNDGWLEGSDHLELHRRGVPHDHPGGGQLHEAQDILLDVTGAAWALQSMGVDLGAVICTEPVRVGGGRTGPTSHGRLPVPAPATQAILDAYQISHEEGPVQAELLTPTGAAILAALSPSFTSDKPDLSDGMLTGVGLGEKDFGSARPNALSLFLKK
ncbi:MAG: tRNA (N6-threonylcarbamoyladenosine(37)-N6)-methyltransferase TrmO [Deltaproteobacteria bacterium]|nr:tRNA (N6-threonylcarbamoyladenosine(37)-N6)-methyltransferase TrmO [Deltaproteobacteria bacterium]